MSPAFRALLWKESVEATRFAVPLLIAFSILYAWEAQPEIVETGRSNPTEGFSWFSQLCTLSALGFGFWQTYRESRGDAWSFAIHRPLSGRQIFAAKIIVGFVCLAIAMIIPWAIALAWISVPGRWAVPVDRSFVFAGIAEFIVTLTFYAAGLYAGARRRRPVSRAIGVGVAVLSGGVVYSMDNAVLALLLSIGLTALVVIAAKAEFMSGSELDAQPLWARAANVAAGIPLALAAVFLVAVIASFSRPRFEPLEKPIWDHPFVRMTSDGQLVKIEGLPPIGPDDGRVREVTVTDMSGRRLPELEADARRGRIGTEGLHSGGVQVDPFDARNPSSGALLRPGYSIQRLFPAHQGPIWYYQRRLGLISLYDAASRRQLGWFSPDGFTKGIEKPESRFSGPVKTNIFEQDPAGLLVTGGGVYELAGLGKPRLVFAAPRGETIIDARLSSGRVRAGSGSKTPPGVGGFATVVTNARTYVVGDSGSVELSVPHPVSVMNREVLVQRAVFPGTPTFLWYSPHRPLPGDTMHHVLEFRGGSSTPVAEYRFGRLRPMGFSLDDTLQATGSEVTLSETVAFLPAGQVFAAVRSADASDRGGAIRAALLSLAVCILLAGGVYWLCRRAAFSRERTMVWTVLTVLTGPVALVLMWMFLDWPARETCGACGKSRVVTRVRCEHCDAAFTQPQLDSPLMALAGAPR